MMKTIILPIMSIFTLVYSKHFVYRRNHNIMEQILYTYIPPKSYVCICVPSYLINENKNITDWDGECSNEQVCYWNKNEVIIKSWYQP